ncbi:hypothetical protein FDK38_005204 [Candidozyma auris]|nr:hypothetical protein FDK38_005204 [[Candida] auris]
MDTTSYNCLKDRISKLELLVGDNSTNKCNRGQSLAAEVAELSAKVERFYKANGELQTLERILETVNDPKKHVAEIKSRNDKVSEAEKQEMLLAKFPAIREAYTNLSELSMLDIPQLSAEIVKRIDLTSVKEKEEAIEAIVRAYHVLVVKNSIVFEKYMALMERENNFWINVERKLNEMRLRLDTLEDKELKEKGV